MKKLFLSLAFTFFASTAFVAAQAEDVALAVGSDIASFSTTAKNIKDYLARNGQGSVDVFDVSKDPDFVSKIQAKKYKVICALGTSPFKKIKDAVKDTPLVFSMVLNPVESGLVSGAGASGQNFTGISLDVPAKIQLELLRKIAPKVKNVGVFYTVKSESMVDEGSAAQGDLGLTLVTKKVEASTDIPSAVHTISAIDALWIVPDVRVCTKDTLPIILNFAAEKKIPILGFADYLVKAGALAAYTYDYADIGAQTGEVILKIINGDNAGSIAITGPRKVGYVINTKTLKYLGIDVSSSVIKSAEQTFE